MLLPKIFTTLRDYDRPTFLGDLGAGITVAMVALPLSVAIATASTQREIRSNRMVISLVGKGKVRQAKLGRQSSCTCGNQRSAPDGERPHNHATHICMSWGLTRGRRVRAQANGPSSVAKPKGWAGGRRLRGPMPAQRPQAPAAPLFHPTKQPRTDRRDPRR